MPTTTNVDVVRELYGALGRGDLHTLLSLVAATCRWDCPGPAEIPWAGSFSGHAGVRTFAAELAEGAEMLAFEPRKFIEQEDTVVVLGFEKARSRRTGRSYEAYWVHAVTVADGRIIVFREYTDTAAVAAAFRG